MRFASGTRSGMKEWLMRRRSLQLYAPAWVWVGALAASLMSVLAAAPAGSFKDSGEGLAWRRDRLSDGPLAYTVVRWDRSRNDLRLYPTLAQGTQIGLNTLTRQLELVPADAGRPVAAINGDFYTTENELFPGDPRGLFISRGELVSAPAQRDCFWLDAQGQPHVGEVRSQFSLKWPDGTMTPLGLNEDDSAAPAVLYTSAVNPSILPRGTLPLAMENPRDGTAAPLRIGERYRVRLHSGLRSRSTNALALFLAPELRTRARQLAPETVLEISTQSTPELRGTLVALGGGPALVRNGRALAARAVKSNQRHPRSALGWNAQHYFLTVVDGRQPDWSIGVTLPALAEYMAGLGCDEAINLDGGGSTELWLQGRILNRPCYGHERPTATGLAVVRREARGTPTPTAKSAGSSTP